MEVNKMVIRESS